MQVSASDLLIKAVTILESSNPSLRPDSAEAQAKVAMAYIKAAEAMEKTGTGYIQVRNFR